MKIVPVFAIIIWFLAAAVRAEQSSEPASTSKNGYNEVQLVSAWGLGRLEGEAFGLSQLRLVIYHYYNDFLAFGISGSGYSSQQSIDLFDTYEATDLGFDSVLLSTYGPWKPFIKGRIVLASKFQASGKILRTITNGKDIEDGMIEFPLPEGGSIFLIGPRKENIHYELKGRMPGIELSLGNEYSINDKLSLITELGYAAKYLQVKTSKIFGGGMDLAKYTYKQRRGLNTSGEDYHDAEIKINRKSRYFSAMFLSLGLSF